jgi:hypothetical protein
MIPEEPLRLAPPWGSKIAWQEVYGNIGYHNKTFNRRVQEIKGCRRQLEDAYIRIVV